MAATALLCLACTSRPRKPPERKIMAKHTYTITFGDKAEVLLEKLSRNRNVTKDEIIRRAFATYEYLISILNADCLNNKKGDGMKLSITNESDEVIKDILLP